MITFANSTDIIPTVLNRLVYLLHFTCSGAGLSQESVCCQQDSFVVRTFNPQVSPMKLLSEIPLKLTRKCLDMFGTNQAVDGETTRKTISKLGFLVMDNVS